MRFNRKYFTDEIHVGLVLSSFCCCFNDSNKTSTSISSVPELSAIEILQWKAYIKQIKQKKFEFLRHSIWLCLLFILLDKKNVQLHTHHLHFSQALCIHLHPRSQSQNWCSAISIEWKQGHLEEMVLLSMPVTQAASMLFHIFYQGY